MKTEQENFWIKHISFSLSLSLNTLDMTMHGFTYFSQTSARQVIAWQWTCEVVLVVKLTIWTWTRRQLITASYFPDSAATWCCLKAELTPGESAVVSDGQSDVQQSASSHHQETGQETGWPTCGLQSDPVPTVSAPGGGEEDLTTTDGEIQQHRAAAPAQHTAVQADQNWNNAVSGVFKGEKEGGKIVVFFI